MQTVLVVVHLFLALGVIGLVLMQHGKGADAGAAFGAGTSGTVFGAAGSANFLSRATAVMATLFFVTSLSLAWFAIQSTERPGLMTEQEQVPSVVVPESPVARESEVPTVPGQARSSSTVPEVPTVAEPAAGGEVPKVAE